MKAKLITQELRLHLSLKLSAVLLAGISVFWGGYYLAQGNGDIWPINLISGIVAAVTAVMISRGKVRAAAIFIFLFSYVITCVFCVFLDLPTLEIPRSTHSYFLVIALFAWFAFKREQPWFRLWMAVASLLAFIFFASNSWGLASSYTLAPEQRLIGSWIHNITAIGLLLTLLWVMQANLTESNVMESDLRKALATNQLVLHFQPQVGNNGRIVGAEALLRWQHPVKGMISPADFIPLAEQTGLILPIGHWVLGTACAQLMAWASDPACAHLHIAVNVSALQFKQPDYVNQVISILERSNINPKLLTLELTESMLVNDVGDIIAKMKSLKARGVRFSLDDFGTGYSSLSYLKKLPIDQLKIDQSFVRDMLKDTNDVAIVRTVVGLARNLKLHVIAEGVETEGQRQFLADLGCHSFQGYLLSRPVPIFEFEGVLVEHSGRNV